MAHRIFLQRSGAISKTVINVTQKFNYLFVLDFEATCEKNSLIVPQEIIEFPCIVLNTQDFEIENIFHRYIKPRMHPNLTSFCTDLTGIMQETVDNEPYFPIVFSQFCTWLKDNNYFNPIDKSAFVTCGNWDLKTMLPNQCAIDNLPLPKEFHQWINLKEIFCVSCKYFPRNLIDMLSHLNLSMNGRLHSGINDVENMVKIIQALNKMYKAQFKITNKLDTKKILI